MTDTEDDPLIERLARARCIAEGIDPDEIIPHFPGESEFEDVPRWQLYYEAAFAHLAMHRELERARGEEGDDDFDIERVGEEAFKRAVKSLPTKDTDQ